MAPLDESGVGDLSPVLANLDRLDRALDRLLALSDELLRRSAWVRLDWWTTGDEGADVPERLTADAPAFFATLTRLDLTEPPFALADDPALGAALAALDRSTPDAPHPSDDPVFVSQLNQISEAVEKPVTRRRSGS